METVDKEFNVRYISGYQYATEMASLFFMSLLWRRVKATLFAKTGYYHIITVLILTINY